MMTSPCHLSSPTAEWQKLDIWVRYFALEKPVLVTWRLHTSYLQALALRRNGKYLSGHHLAPITTETTLEKPEIAC
jgi:hypothetical protein